MGTQKCVCQIGYSCKKQRKPGALGEMPFNPATPERYPEINVPVQIRSPTEVSFHRFTFSLGMRDLPSQFPFVFLVQDFSCREFPKQCSFIAPLIICVVHCTSLEFCLNKEDFWNSFRSCRMSIFLQFCFWIIQTLSMRLCALIKYCKKVYKSHCEPM